ncbi:MAG: helix-turn-helix transcriptional regulator [Candidatus Omnitrophica bacterium]|nr:helix-turn-helix transcriptional regulator [Candidatus Omnitrophota bacterium]
MDKGLEIKELAELIGVTPDSVINWEIRGVKPREESLKKLTRTLDFL